MVPEAYQKELYLSIITIGIHRALLDSTFQIASVILFQKERFREAAKGVTASRNTADPILTSYSLSGWRWV